ncbi:precorrin-2 dehydrogenase [Weizmannia acidilactici]|uniref:precorrin-2 dehydrogenase n=1 Tax=Weizmannia acidilactici TaxID=2607726 RepID=A0A5J4JEM7_9BACI|nr:NAD(P)-binding protein [Weizmannia acidilactici]GER70141.1 precorrin-2 dehydrogenase [Weizmannia acidilactici]
MASVPVMVDFKGKQVVVIGGGKIAARRIRILQKAGARITVVSPSLDPELQSLAAQGKIRWKQKRFEPDDVNKAEVVIAATNDRDVNKWAVAHAPVATLINDAGNAENGDLMFPALLQKGRLSISVSTDGASPKLASRIITELSNQYDDAYGRYVDFLYECRQLLKQPAFTVDEKKEWLEKLLAEEYRTPEKQSEVLAFLKIRTGKPAR